MEFCHGRGHCSERNVVVSGWAQLVTISGILQWVVVMHRSLLQLYCLNG